MRWLLTCSSLSNRRGAFDFARFQVGNETSTTFGTDNRDSPFRVFGANHCSTFAPGTRYFLFKPVLHHFTVPSAICNDIQELLKLSFVPGNILIFMIAYLHLMKRLKPLKKFICRLCAVRKLSSPNFGFRSKPF